MHMTINLENLFAEWAKPPGPTEQQRIENAVGVVRNAIKGYPPLSGRTLKVFVQGSYRNRVNVRADSDVDVGVLCSDIFLPTYPTGRRHADFGIQPATYLYPQFKDELEQALVAYLGRGAVLRGNKALDLHENTYRVEADVTLPPRTGPGAS